jgi:lactobin A/cerein 7B family class IIb bacteriocin
MLNVNSQNWSSFMTELEFQNVQETSRSVLGSTDVTLLGTEQNHSNELSEEDLEEISGGPLPALAVGALAIGGGIAVAAGVTYGVGVVKGWLDSETEHAKRCHQ